MYIDYSKRLNGIFLGLAIMFSIVVLMFVTQSIKIPQKSYMMTEISPEKEDGGEVIKKSYEKEIK